MDLQSIPLRDEWARRELKIVVRDVQSLSSTSRLLLEYLCAAEGSEQSSGRKPDGRAPAVRALG
jgi:hypothetical protein